MTGRLGLSGVLAALLLLGTALTAAATASPEDRPRVSLRLSPCLVVDRAQVEHLLTIELGAQLADAPDGATSDLSVTCGAAGAELRVDDPLTGKSLFRIIDLEVAQQRARPRLLALALAELVFTSWTELAIPLPVPPPEPQAPVVLPGGRSLAPASARSADSRLRILALASGQAFSGTGLLWGGGLRAAGDYAHHLGFSADALAHHGQSSFPLGDVAIDTLSASAALVVHARLSFLCLRVGAGGRLGAAHLAGVPQDVTQGAGASLWGAFGGPLALLVVGAPISGHMVAELSLEGGYVTLPVAGRVDGQRAVAVDGGWIAAQLGLGWRK